MHITLLQHLAAGNEWGAICPELALGCLALALLGLEILLPKTAQTRIPEFGIAALVAIMAGVVVDFHSVTLGHRCV